MSGLTELLASEAEAGTIRVCPERDGRCPHGIDCPYAIDRYRCDMEASRASLISRTPATGGKP